MVIIGHRGIYRVTENEENHDFYAHWGANVLSAVWRFSQAVEIAKDRDLPIHIGLQHLSRDGEYMEIDENDTGENYSVDTDKPFCDRVSSQNYIADFHEVEEYIAILLTFVLFWIEEKSPVSGAFFLKRKRQI